MSVASRRAATSWERLGHRMRCSYARRTQILVEERATPSHRRKATPVFDYTSVTASAIGGAQDLSIEPGTGDFAQLVTRFALSLQDVRSPRVDLIEQIVVGAVQLVPGARHAAVVTSEEPGRLAAKAVAGNGVPRDVMNLQNRGREGPCLDAIADGKLILVPHVATDIRWPNFGPAAARAGAGAMLCIPLIIDDQIIGALTLIGDLEAFDDEAQSLGRVFAAHAAIALASAQRVTNLQTALSSRDVIGQAKGILMERFRLTPELAFAALVRASSESNVKLRTVCEELCTTGLLAGKERTSG
jgi:GAF domain-containing protein